MLRTEIKSGVLVVDVQGDFTTWKNGSLAVEGTDEAFVRSVEDATRLLKEGGFLVFGTQDWHPPDHISFAPNHAGKMPLDVIRIDGRSQVLWPPHCVQGTENARILIDSDLFLAVVKKGTHAQFDSYSGFQDDGGSRTEMEDLLRRNGVTTLVVFGIATDYCVRATAIDAVRSGFKVVVVESLCRGVASITTAQALKEMRQSGVNVVKDPDIKTIRSLL